MPGEDHEEPRGGDCPHFAQSTKCANHPDEAKRGLSPSNPSKTMKTWAVILLLYLLAGAFLWNVNGFAERLSEMCRLRVVVSNNIWGTK